MHTHSHTRKTTIQKLILRASLNIQLSFTSKTRKGKDVIMKMFIRHIFLMSGIYQAMGDEILKQENENFVLYCPTPNNETIIACIIRTNNGVPLETKLPGDILDQGRIKTFGEENGMDTEYFARKQKSRIWESGHA